MQQDRALYRRLLGYDDATWARARGWVVEQTVLYIPYYARSLPMAVAQAKTRLEAALSDEAGAQGPCRQMSESGTQLGGRFSMKAAIPSRGSGDSSRAQNMVW